MLDRDGRRHRHRYQPAGLLVISSPGALGAIIVALTLTGFATLLFGLVLFMPILGHASWHAYKELVNSPSDSQRHGRPQPPVFLAPVPATQRNDPAQPLLAFAHPAAGAARLPAAFRRHRTRSTSHRPSANSSTPPAAGRRPDRGRPPGHLGRLRCAAHRRHRTAFRAWGVVGHLHSVNDIPAWREAYNALLPEVTRFTANSGRTSLFDQYKALQASPEYPGSTPPAAASSTTKCAISAVRRRAAEEQNPASRPSWKSWPRSPPSFRKPARRHQRLRRNRHRPGAASGLPRMSAKRPGALPKKAGDAGWRFTLHAPSYGPVMQYADDRELRARLYRAYATRAAEFHRRVGRNGTTRRSCGASSNCELPKRRMLGYAISPSFPWCPRWPSRRHRCWPSAELAAKAKPFAERDIAELREFRPTPNWASPPRTLGLGLCGGKLQQARYAFSEQEVKQYFTEPAVLAGLFRVIENLFNVRVKADTAPVWHPEVRFYRLETPGGDLVGQFYLDLYARETKRAAPGWTKPDHPPPHRDRHPDRWPTSTAIFRPVGAARRPSPTRKSSPSSTKPATACTTS